MKKICLSVMALVIACMFLGCKQEEQEPTLLYIEPAQLTEEERNIVSLIGREPDPYIYDFVLDSSVQSIQVNIYELVDGTWELISGGGGMALSNAQGRIALEFENLIGQGYQRIAIQSDDNSSSTSHTPGAEVDSSSIGYATSMLDDRTNIVYEQEIPLLLQIATAKNQILSYGIDAFYTPEAYEKYGYEHVYAVTVRFSQKTVLENSQEASV